jgi:hypothetical protein
MPVSLASRSREVFVEVEVRDPSDQQRAALGPLPPSTTMAEVRTRAVSELRVPRHVEWNLRCENSGRLLNDQQRLGNLQLAEGTCLVLALQPEAWLG